MSISFETIELVIALQKQKSLSKVAQSLFISEPALSKKIKKIEEELGYRLVNRSANGSTLTHPAKLLAERGMALINMRDALLLEMKDAADKVAAPVKRLSLGIASCYAETVLPRFLPAFIKAYPDIKVDVYSTRTDILEKKCVAGEIDLIVTQTEPSNEMLEYYPLMTEETVIYVPASFADDPKLGRYIAKGKMPLRLLKAYPHAEVQGHVRFRDFVEPFYKEAKFTPNTIYRTENWSSVMQLVAQSLCYSVMPDVFDPKSELIKRVRIDSKFSPYRTLTLAYSKKRLPSVEWEAFIGLAQKLLSPSLKAH